MNNSFHTRKMCQHHTLFIPQHLRRLLWIQVEKCSLTALSASLQTFSLQTSRSDWAFKLKYKRPPTYPACCFLCKWCCVFKHSFILNPYFILPDINPVIFLAAGPAAQQRHASGRGCLWSFISTTHLSDDGSACSVIPLYSKSFITYPSHECCHWWAVETPMFNGLIGV